MGAFARAPLSESSIEQLAIALTELDLTQSDLAVRARRRPGIGYTQALAESAARLEAVWREYEQALTAPTPLAAQEGAKRAQALMDTASDPLVAAREMERAATILDDQSRPVPIRVLEALETRFPNTALPELLTAGGAHASSQLGIEVGPNSGLSYLLLESIAARSLDPGRFREKLRICAAGSRGHDRLSAIASMDGALKALSETHRLIVEAALAYQAAVARDGDDRSVMRRTGRLVSELYESGSAPFAWYRLLARETVASDAFERQTDDDVTAMVAKLQNGQLSTVFADAERFLRNAPSHGRAFDFDPETRQVLIRLRRHPETEIHIDDYVDRAFAFLETLLAAVWGLESSLEIADIDLTLSDADAMYLGFAPVALAAATLPRLAKLRVDEFSAADGVWRFDVTTEESDLLVTALAIASIPRVDAREVVIRASDDPELTIGLASMRDLGAAGDPRSTMMSLLHIKRNATIAGEPVLARSDVQFLLIVLGMDAIDGDVSTIRHLRQLRSWSEQCSWAEEASLSARLMAATRGVGVDSVRGDLVKLVPHKQQPVLPAALAVRVLLDE